MLNLKNTALRPEGSSLSFSVSSKNNICWLFQNEVKKRPSSVAAKIGNAELTYKELDEKSTTLALWLKLQGVSSEVVVGISLDYGFDLLVGIFAVFKAGGAYFPLDHNYPQERLEFLLEDANPSILLTQSRFFSKFESYQGRVIQIDNLAWDRIPEEIPESQEFLQEPKPEDLAYLIYTSGSTGRPKGIMISYHSLLHIATLHKNHYPTKIIGIVTGSIAFDISMLTIFSALLSGGTVCFLTSSSNMDPNEIINLIIKNHANYLLCVPSLYSLVMEKSKLLPSLRTVSLAGEILTKELPYLHSKYASNAILYNEYAPSECACGATIAKIYDPIEDKIKPITIGTPLPNTQIYILDENLNPVPKGSKGEIFIAGLGLARGYLNQQDLTDERFIDLSINDMPLVRMYRTGDYGRILSDGNLEFLGRIDSQVNIRGYRIELSEIESIIHQCEWVKAAAVIVETYQGSDRLVAFFSTISRSYDVLSLKKYLSQILPIHMLPSVLIPIEQFPRNSNGKINREILLHIAKNHKKETIQNDSPQTKLEQEIYQIWKDVLAIESFGCNENFFDLGGSSLNIAIVQTRIDTHLNKKISLLELLQHPTITKLSNYLDKKKPTSISSSNQEIAINRRNSFKRFKTRGRHA